MALKPPHSPSANMASISCTCLSAFVVLHSVSYCFLVVSKASLGTRMENSNCQGPSLTVGLLIERESYTSKSSKLSAVSDNAAPTRTCVGHRAEG